MDIKKLVLKILGLGFLGLAFLALFVGLILLLAPYEIDQLQKKAEEEYPEKIVTLVNLVMPEELENISLSEVKTGCALRGALNISASSLNIPLSDADLNLLCEKANEAVSIAELKQLFISAKVNGIITEVFPKVKREYIEPYSSGYVAIMLVAFLVFYALFALVAYFASEGVFSWLGNIASHTFFYSMSYILALVMMYFVVPGMINSTIMGSPQISEMLSQIPEAQRPAANIFIFDTIILVSDWFNGFLTHLILAYGALMLVSGFGWLGITAMAKAEKES